jgi:hypothetical protein
MESDNESAYTSMIAPTSFNELQRAERTEQLLNREAETETDSSPLEPTPTSSRSVSRYNICEEEEEEKVDDYQLPLNSMHVGPNTQHGLPSQYPMGNNSFHPRPDNSYHAMHAPSLGGDSFNPSVIPNQSPLFNPSQFPSPPGSYMTVEQRKIMMETIEEYVPANMQTRVFEDVVSQINQLHEKGFTKPKNYNEKEHSLDENEINLYEQQMAQHKSRDEKKMTYLINFSAMGVNWFCQSMALDWIKTNHLPELIRKSVADGEFNDGLDGIGKYLRGTIFDHPVFSTALKFVEKVGEAHHEEVEKELDQIYKEKKTKTERNQTALHTLNQFRQGPSNNHSPSVHAQTHSLVIPLPDAATVPQSRLLKKKGNHLRE